MKHVRLKAVGGGAALLALTACAGLPGRDAGQPAYAGDPAIQSVAQANTEFGLEILGQLDEPGKNIFLSPASLTTAFGLLRAGAAGTTAEELDRVLHITLPEEDYHAANGRMVEALNTDKEDVTVSINNAVWAEQTAVLEPDYLARVKTAYGAPDYRVDYIGHPDASREIINRWVEEKTHDRIKDLLSQQDVTEDTRNILVNTVYLKADWAVPFGKEASKDAPFYLTPSNTVDVPMMNQTRYFRYFRSVGVELAELPYKDNEFSMVLFLPRAKDGLEKLEAALVENPEKFDGLVGRLMAKEPTRLELKLPKLKIEARYKLEGPLKSLGMVESFSDFANFGRMARPEKQPGGNGLKVDKVIHQTFLEVDEEGTEAAAATAILMVAVSSAWRGPPPPPPIPFHVDHPYMFAIRHNATGMILFLGRVEDPR